MASPHWLHLPILLEVFFSWTAIAEIGPYKWTPTQIVDCDDIKTEGLMGVESSKMYRVNRTSHIFNGTIYSKVPITNDLNARIHFNKFGNGGWKKDIIVLEIEGACEKLKYYYAEFYKYLSDYYNFTGCPIAPGRFDMVNFKMNEVKTNANTVRKFEYGTYRVLVEVYDAEKVYGCKGIATEVLPLKTKKRG